MESTKETFERLYQQWKKETIFHSNMTIVWKNKNYQEILSLGKEILPFIFEKMLWHEYGHWYDALQKLTGEDAAKNARPGYILEMNEAWLNWAREHGYVTKSEIGQEIIKNIHLSGN